MAKRKTATFGIAFMDLLSGALGAVIILLITVPKLDAKKERKDVEVIVKQHRGPKKENKGNMKFRKMESKIKKLNSKIDMISRDNQEMLKTNSKLEALVSGRDIVMKERAVVSAKNIDIGFKFKGKKILFIIDTSGSMKANGNLGRVIAGLKMVVTTMSDDYMIDVASFPRSYAGSRLGNKSCRRNSRKHQKYFGNFALAYTAKVSTSFKTHEALFSALNPASSSVKNDIYKFLYKLTPRGGTPTKEVLEYALDNYSGLTDIVLLSDGSPTGSTPQEVLRAVAMRNMTNIKISTVGVGRGFARDRRSRAYDFLKNLAEENDGFFVPF